MSESQFTTLVARYNCSKYVERMRSIEGGWEGDVVVQNKGDDGVQQELLDLRTLTRGSVSCETFDNIGREGHSYLSQIIRNYDRLPEYVFFTQDDWHNHLPVAKVRTIRDLARGGTLGNTGGFWHIQCSWREGGAEATRGIVAGCTDLHTFPAMDAIRQWCLEFGVECPAYQVTPCCAFFIVGRDRIRRRQREFQEGCLEWLMRGAEGREKNPANGFVLEHLWHLIFRD